MEDKVNKSNGSGADKVTPVHRLLEYESFKKDPRSKRKYARQKEVITGSNKDMNWSHNNDTFQMVSGCSAGFHDKGVGVQVQENRDSEFMDGNFRSDCFVVFFSHFRGHILCHLSPFQTAKIRCKIPFA